MKPTIKNRFRNSLPILTFISLSVPSYAADRWWDGGTVNIGTNGDGASSFLAGTWNATLTNWDQGAGLSHVAWNNGDTAIFGGTPVNTIRVTTLGSSVTVSQIKIISGGTGNFRHDIGVATDATNAITFSGTYSDTTPAIDASGALNNNFPAKITGSPSGGLVIKHGSDSTSPASGRFALTNANSDFVGDVILVGGNISSGTQLGNAANKLVLKGGSLFFSNGGAVSLTFSRNIEVATASGLNTNATASGLQSLDLTGTITGSANLTRYVNASGTSSSEIRFSGSMAGFTGTYENVGPTATSIATIQTSATSGGAWKLTGGTLKLNTIDDTHIANGIGKSDLLVNGGTLNMNGKSETINGLSGTSGTVQNALASTSSTLTLGDADTTAAFAGIIRNNGGTGGTVALTKTGAGTQTLSGVLAYTGATNVNGGKLMIASSAIGLTPITVAPSTTLGFKLSNAVSPFSIASLATGTGAGSTIQLDTDRFGTVATPALTTTTFTPGTGATTLIKLKGYNFSVGTLSLVKYTTLDGAGFAGLDKQLPYRVVGNLVDNTIDPLDMRVDLNITSAESAVWTGEVGGTADGNWDVNPDADGTAGTFNWKTSVFGTPTRYAQGPVNTDQVTFDDNLSATGTTTVNLTTTLTPLHILVNNSTDKTYTFTGTGKLSGETSLEKDNSGTLIIANTALNDFTGGTIITTGTLQLGDGTTLNAGRISGAIANSADLVFNHPDAMSSDNTITGSNGFVLKKGTNTLTLSGNNTYSGGTTISKGALVAAANNAFGTNGVTLGDDESGMDTITLSLDNRADVGNAVIVSSNGGLATLAASNTGTGTTNPASFTGTITLDRATTFRSDLVGDRLLFTGKITSTDTTTPVNLTIAGGQNVTLQGTASDFTGTLSVTGSGTVLQASNNTVGEVIPDAVTVDLATGTFLKLFGTTMENLGRLTGTGKVTRHESATTAQTIAVGIGDLTSEFDGEINNNPGSGTGTLTFSKVGNGIFTLNGSNHYTGSTTIGGGTLLVNGSITSTVLASAGTIGGTGTVGAITATTAGKVSPATDTTTGTLTTTGNVSFATGTEFAVQINSDGTPASDKLAVTGTLTLGAAVSTLNITDLGTTTFAATTKLVLATATGAITGTFKDTLGNAIPNGGNVTIGSNIFKIKYNDTVGILNAITATYVGADYAGWAYTNGVGVASADNDNDGGNNGIEYVLGTDPKVSNATGIIATTSATDFKFTFTRSDASETPDTAVWIETSNDLVNWNSDGSPNAVGATSSGNVTIVENPADPGADPGSDTVTLTVPRNTPAKFARLKVVVTP